MQNLTSPNPNRPAMRSSWQICKSVWYALTLREVQSMFWSRRFGAFWVLAEPIAQIVIMMLIFSYTRGRIAPGVPFALWLLVGMLPFLMMRSIIFSLMGAVSANKQLFTYRQVRPFDTYVARTAVQVMTSVATYLILAFAMVFFLSYQIPVYEPVHMFATFVVMVFYAVALGIIFSLLVHVLPESAAIIRLMFLPLYMLSGVIFPLGWVPQPYYNWLLWNPFMHLIDMFRQYSLENYTPLPGVNLLYPAESALVGLFIAVMAYRRRQYDLVES